MVCLSSYVFDIDIASPLVVWEEGWRRRRRDERRGDLQEWEWLVADGLFIHARGQRVRGGVAVSDADLMTCF